MRHLDLEGAIQIHKEIMTTMNEPVRILNQGSLEFCIDTALDVATKLDLLCACIDKAAYYIWCIASNHPFLDGNKRTAYQSAYIFLEANGYTLHDVTENEVVLFMNGVAMGTTSKSEIRAWVKKHIKPINN